MSKRKLLIGFFGLVVIFSVFLANFMRGQYVVPILMYHSVDPEASPKNLLAISLETFQRQMRFLKIHRYNVIPLETLGDLIRSRKQLPPKTIVITLDDGYKDNYIYAFPVLRKYNLPATIFIITNEVGRSDRLSWDEIKQMRDSGIITVGSHTMGPEPLTKINVAQQVKDEIFESKKILEEKLGVQIKAFSYPEGRFNAAIRQLVIDAGYELAVSTNPGRKYHSDDIFALKRLRISSNCANLFVYWVESSGYYNFFREKRHKK